MRRLQALTLTVRTSSVWPHCLGNNDKYMTATSRGNRCLYCLFTFLFSLLVWGAILIKTVHGSNMGKSGTFTWKGPLVLLVSLDLTRKNRAPFPLVFHSVPVEFAIFRGIPQFRTNPIIVAGDIHITVSVCSAQVGGVSL